MEAVITVSESSRNPEFNMVSVDELGYCSLLMKNVSNIYRRQDTNPVFNMTTVCYVVKPDFIRNHTSLFDGSVKAIKIPKIRSVDIDDIDDFRFAEYLFKMKNKNG